jgi:hypothetical protein
MTTVKVKTVEEFRVEVTDAIYKAIKKEINKSAAFTRTADYLSAKLAEAKIEGLHIALGAIIDAATVEVKEE